MRGEKAGFGLLPPQTSNCFLYFSKSQFPHLENGTTISVSPLSPFAPSGTQWKHLRSLGLPELEHSLDLPVTSLRKFCICNREL